jgi:hypothetical protein
VTAANGMSEITGMDKGHLLRVYSERRFVSLRKPPEAAYTAASLKAEELHITEKLRRPTEDELAAQIRHAVLPLFAGVVTE